MEQINLREFLKGVKSRPYKDLIRLHIKEQSTFKLLQACVATTTLLPQDVSIKMEAFIDHMNSYAYSAQFWTYTCYEVFNIIIEDAYSYFNIGKYKYISLDDDIPLEDQEMLFNLFQIVTLSYAYSASDQPEMRKFMGIRKGFFTR